MSLSRSVKTPEHTNRPLPVMMAAINQELEINNNSSGDQGLLWWRGALQVLQLPPTVPHTLAEIGERVCGCLSLRVIPGMSW